jgi:hypothetical protein
VERRRIVKGGSRTPFAATVHAIGVLPIWMLFVLLDHRSPALSGRLERVLEVGDQVVRMLEPDGQSEEPRRERTPSAPARPPRTSIDNIPP